VSLLRFPELPTSDPVRLGLAVRSVLEHHVADSAAPSLSSESLVEGPLADAFSTGAHDLGAHVDTEAAQHLLTLLESAYLVAASDGLSAEELDALTVLVAQVAGSELDAETLRTTFHGFGTELEKQGRPARIAAIAGAAPDFVTRHELLLFAALIAAADGHVARKETRVLIELSEAFECSLSELDLVVKEVGASLVRALNEA
jgi:tellurite resistance protein